MGLKGIFGAGDSHSSDAANSASANEDAIYKKIMLLQEQLTGFVQHADQSGMYDPERAAERFRKDFDTQHGTDLEAQATGMAHAGFKPGDSEVAYNDQKLKGRLMQDELHGAEAARHAALQEKFAAYAMPAQLFGPAAQTAALSGQFGVQGGQFEQKSNQDIWDGLGAIAGAAGGFSKPAAQGSPGAVPAGNPVGGMDPNNPGAPYPTYSDPRKRRAWSGFQFEN